MAPSSPRSSNRSQKQAARLAPLANVLQLQSDQTSDRRQSDNEDASRLRDTTLSDDSVSSSGDAPRSSVLDLGTRSYAEPETPSTTGGGVQEDTTASITRTRELQEAMTREREQLVGVERMGRGNEGQTQTANEETTEDEDEDEEENKEEEEQNETDRASQFMQERAQEQRQQLEAQQQQASQAQAQRAQKQATRKAKKATNTGIRFVDEGAELVTSETIVPLIILIIQLNVQMIMKYLLRPILGGSIESATEGAPWLDQSLVEDFITINVDILLTCGSVCCNPCCAPFVFLIIIAGAIDQDWTSVLGAIWYAIRQVFS